MTAGGWGWCCDICGDMGTGVPTAAQAVTEVGLHVASHGEGTGAIVQATGVDDARWYYGTEETQ